MQPLIWSFSARFSPTRALSGGICHRLDAAGLPLPPQRWHFTLNAERCTLHDWVNLLALPSRPNSPSAHQIPRIYARKTREKTCTWSLIIPSEAFAAHFQIGIIPPSVVASLSLPTNRSGRGGVGDEAPAGPPLAVQAALAAILFAVPLVQAAPAAYYLCSCSFSGASRITFSLWHLPVSGVSRYANCLCGSSLGNCLFARRAGAEVSTAIAFLRYNLWERHQQFCRCRCSFFSINRF